MTRKSFILAFAALTAFAFGAAQAQAKPNFSGTWKLNNDKSEFGPMPAPEKMVMTITHAEPNLNVKTAQSGGQGDMEYEAKYVTDGTETTNTIGPMEAKSTCKWDGDALKIVTKLNLGGSDVVIDGKWVLSEDGKTIVNSAHVTTPQGELDIKYVLDKQ